MPVTDEISTEIDAAVETLMTERADETTQVEGEIVEPADKETEAVESLEPEDEITQETTEVAETAEEVVEETTEVPGTTTVTTPPGISDNTLARAIHAGMSVTDARSFPNDQALASVCTMLEKAAEEVPSVKEEELTEDPLNAFDNLDPDVYDPEVTQLLGTLVSEIRSQRDTIKALGSSQEQAAQATQEVSAREIEQWFDEQVTNLGKEFADSLGSGGYSSLEKASPQFQKRDAIANQMSILMAGYGATGRQAPAREEVFSQAARLVLGEEYTKISERKLRNDLHKRSKQHISRAGGHGDKGVTQSPQDETAELLKEQFGI